MRRDRTIRSRDEHLEKKILVLKQQGKHREGLELLKKYLKTHKTTDRVKLHLAFFYYHRHYLEKAAKIYMEVLRNNKDCMSTLQFLARVYGLMKRKEAIALATTAYTLSPNFVMANNLAGIYEMLGQNELAEYWYKKCLRLAQNKEEKLVIKSNLVFLYKKTGASAQAAKYVKEILGTKSFRGKKEYQFLIATLIKSFPRK